MIVAPQHSMTQRTIRSSLIFVPITLLYSALVLPSFVDIFPALANPQLTVIQSLLGTQSGATVAWIHFLAFDLFVGCWIFHDSQKIGLARWIQTTCLIATFMAGPFGWLCYIIIRRIKCGSFALV